MQKIIRKYKRNEISMDDYNNNNNVYLNNK